MTESPNLHLTRRAALRLAGLAGAGALLGGHLPRAFASSPAAGKEEPSLAGTQPGFYRLRIGSLEALALSDGGITLPAEKSPIGVGEAPEAISAELRNAVLAPDQIRLVFNVLLVRAAGELILIDTGCGSLLGPTAGKLVSHLASAGIAPGQISAILVTHMHGDHFGGLLDAEGRPVFANAKVFMHRAEHEYWAKSDDAVVRKHLEAFKGKWQLIRGGDKLVDGIEIVDAFGHTPGHIAVTVTSGDEQLFHIVDIAHHHVLSFAHPEWVNAFDVESNEAIATRRRLYDRLASDRSRVFGGHLPFPSLGRIRRAGPAYEYLNEPWSTA